LNSNPDVVIIGAGSSGTSTAFALAKRGLKVSVIERNLIGSGPSGHAAGIVNSHNPFYESAVAGLRSTEKFLNFRREYGEDLEFHKIGVLYLFPLAVKGRLEKYLPLLNKAGIEIEMIGHNRASELVTGLKSSDSDTVFVFENQGGYCDPMEATRAYANAALKLGVEILEGHEVIKILTQGGKAAGVQLPEESINSSKILLTVGPSVNNYLRDFGTSVAVVPERTEVLFLSRPKETELRTVVVDYVNGVYYRPDIKDRIFVGYITKGVSLESANFVPTSLGAGDQSVMRWGNTFQVAKELYTWMCQSVPNLKNSYWMGGYECHYDTSSDSQPILDEVAAVNSLYLVTGLSGKGFHFSPWIGQQMADFIADGRKPDQLKPFSISRFEKPEGYLKSVYA
jgi:sarcosine oxidase subunit beta